MIVTPDVFRQTIQKYVGAHYGFCDRCGGGCHPQQFDCSGLMCKGTNETGLTRNVCTSSFVLAQQCYDLGLLVSWEQAQLLDGLWWIRGDDLGRRDNGSKANGASGHIVYRVRHVDPGTGVVTFYTIEAMGRRYGVVNGSTDSRVWDAAYKIPGMVYTPPITPRRERNMILQPGRPSSAEGQDAYVIVSADGKSIECWNGASLANDQPTGTPRLRRWVPVNLGGNRLVGACARAAGNGDDHPGIAVADNTGREHRGRWS